jgi:SRSO17 transposase
MGCLRTVSVSKTACLESPSFQRAFAEHPPCSKQRAVVKTRPTAHLNSVVDGRKVCSGRSPSQPPRRTCFAAYVGELANVIGHVGQVAPLHDYCAGLLASEGRRSVEPMAALTAPAELSVQHQRLLHFVGEADWSDARVLMKVRQVVVPVIEDGEPIKAWIIDDTSYPKQGNHSVGVHHQYCGQLGKQANCQAAVTLSIANHHASLPIAHQLYLPKAWATDAARRRKAHVRRRCAS